MYIKEVILEGFKSYSTRTVLTEFDPHFNAITGLNGSGKSNILDAICFVLGITNLSQVRVGNLQELIYKQCQAGIIKASVTIVFDNSEPQQSPVGYEQCQELTVTRQVVVGGRNKYLINGKNVQAGQVQNLFHSVQLNVNNPHFLIMQGRITKVLNMKPQEILGMVEEAAGTRMFETKKQAAIKTIEKKQSRVAEIEAILDNEISPQLDKLRSEREGYLRWSSNSTEIERLQRNCVAYDYLEAKLKVENSENDLAEMKEEMRQLADESSELKEAIKAKTDEIRRFEALMNDDDDDSQYKRLKDKQEEAERELIKSTASMTNKKESLQSEKDQLKKLNHQLAQFTAELNSKTSELQEKESIFAIAEEEVRRIEDLWRDLQAQYEDACSGISSNKRQRGKRQINEEKNLLDAVGTAEEDVRQYESQAQQTQSKLEHTVNLINQLESDVRGRGNEDSKQERAYETLKSELRSIETSIDRLGYDDSEHEAISSERIEIVRHVDDLMHKKDRLQVQMSNKLNFEFQDPVRGFDRSRVKGITANLIQVNNQTYATALEVAAGPRLFQVVVDTEQTGKLLLEQGRLQRRVTIIPLNKISHPIVSSDKQSRARRIASSLGGQAQVALELVGFDDEVRNAIEYVFGTSLICSSSEIAKQVAFNKDIRIRSVSAEGDVFDPSGTMTGGSNQHIGVILTKLHELSTITQEIEELKARLLVIDAHLQESSAASGRYQSLMTQKELKEHEISKLSGILKNTAKGSLRVQLEEAQTRRTELTQEHEDYSRRFQEASDLLASMRSSKKGQSREDHLAQLQRDTSDAKISFSRKSEALKEKRMKLLASTTEVKAMQREMSDLNEQIESCQSNIAELEGEWREIVAEVEKIQADAKRARDKFQVIKSQRCDQGSKIQELEQEIEASRERIQVCTVEIKRVQVKIVKFQKDVKEAEKSIQQSKKMHTWIDRDEEYFGKPGTEYDFSKRNITTMKDRLETLQQENEKIGKKVNKKVMGMIEKVETEYRDLIRKKQVIENDKQKIELVISELDVKKIEALNTTWVKVNHDFGNIFSTLLPGTMAKLAPPDGMEVTEGLEVKVAFGNVWKDSLTELSGGQRSLLALSLILSMLLFKPAPVYILDEVDAALDLSHTQNIGTILRTHFTNSQFVVVSLKEGMFNNANVVYRTRFVDGISTVSRTVGAAGLSQRTIMDASEGPFFRVSSNYDQEEEAANLHQFPARKRKTVNSKQDDDDDDDNEASDVDEEQEEKVAKKVVRGTRENKTRIAKQNIENQENDEDEEFDDDDDDEEEIVSKKKKQKGKKAAAGAKRRGNRAIV